MNKNYFTYSRKEAIAPKDGEENEPLKYNEYKDGFNTLKVIRSLTTEDGNVLILLDDIHQRLQEMPVYNKQGKQTATRNVMNAFQSEIILNPQDGERFYKLIEE